MARPKIKASKLFTVCPSCDEEIEYKGTDTYIICSECGFVFMMVNDEAVPVETESVESLEDLIEKKEENEEDDNENQ